MTTAYYHDASGETIYLAIWNAAGQIYNRATPGFEAFAGGNWTAAKYCLAATEVGAGRYAAVMPALGVGWYTLDWRIEAGSSPAATDSGAASVQYWDGTNWGAWPQALVAQIAGSLDTNVGSRAAPGAQMDWVNSPNSNAMAIVRNGLFAPISTEAGGV